MITIQNIKLKWPHEPELVRERAANSLKLRKEDLLSFEIIRRSFDARKKPEIYVIYTVEVGVHNEQNVLHKALKQNGQKVSVSLSDRVAYRFPEETAEGKSGLYCYEERPVIVGAGPAGLFCAYYLARAGLRPILIERGKCVEERRKDVETFWETGRLNPASNVQFGEGGAGTFSDGKLNTLVKDKSGRNRAVLETFVRFGAKENILYDAKPHIGTDVLFEVLRNLRDELQRLGTEIRYECCMTGLILEEKSCGKKVTGIRLDSGETLFCNYLVIAIGHSARDTMFMLHETGLSMEPKAFAVGFRVEHPQEMINYSQYGLKDPGDLKAAPYKVTAKTTSGRGVYSFCMCPGGYVVNASSEEGRLAVNGMSYSGRDGRNANSAIIVSVTPEDYPGEGPLSGIAFQRELEEKAYRLGNGKIPVQRYGAYRRAVAGEAVTDQGKMESDLIPQCKGGYVWTDLSGLLPKECGKAFVEGMTQFGKQIRGFDREDAILSGVESRTSSPVRILRDDHLEADISGIYPCGEGAGYAGGITSAAMDGLRVAEEITERLQKSLTE